MNFSSKAGIRRIGELELEHQRDAQFVAGVEERVVLVKSAAPEPDEVEVARRRVLHIRAQHLGRDPRQQIVGWDHIRSLGEKWLPVDLQRISRLPRLRDGLELPQPDSLPHRIEHSPAGVQQLHLHGVEVLLAQPIRPPELRLRDGQRERRRQTRDRLLDRCAFFQQARAHRTARGSQARQVRRHVQPHGTIGIVVLDHGQVRQPRIIGAQFDALPDAHRQNRTAPVPTPLVRRFADPAPAPVVHGSAHA